MSTPLLVCEAARIDDEGRPLLEGLSCQAGGPRAALVGDWSALFALLAGNARLTSGSVQVAGHPAHAAVIEGHVGLVLADPPLPPRWTAGTYVSESASLLGLSRRAAQNLARSTLDGLGLNHLESRRLETLTVMEQRAVLLAHALLPAPAALALEAPLAGLDERSERWLSDLIHRVATERAVLLSIPHAGATGVQRAWLDAASDVLTLSGGTVQTGVREPGNARRYVVGVQRHASELAQRLTENGLALTPTDAPGTALDLALLAVTGGTTRFVVELRDAQDTRVIFEASLLTDAPLLELVPIDDAR